MKKLLLIFPVAIMVLTLGLMQPAGAQSEPGYYSAADQPEEGLLSPEEVDDLVAPIALYPDPLIAQILPAATFIDQIDEATRYVKQYGRMARIDDQPWDVSVKAVAHYPEVLFMMDQKYDWTVSLGQAYLDQPQDLMESIQVLRAEARDQGNLISTPQQEVVIESGGDIRIVPAAPEYIYVPVYDPQVVYVEPGPSYGFVTFGVGLAIGAWLSRDMDWHGHRVYYHGWRSGGWVGRSRPHIRDRRGVYINQRAATINTNRRVLQHDTGRFRQELRHDAERHRNLPGRPAPTPRVNRPGTGGFGEHGQGRPEQPRPPRTEPQRSPAGEPQTHAPAGRPPAAGERPAAAGERRPGAGERPAAAGERRPGAGQRPPAAVAQPPAAAPSAAAPQPAAAAGARPATNSGTVLRDVFRGRDVRQTQPASRTGYGGYGSGKDAATYRERGQASRENMRQGGRPAPAAQPAAAPAAAPAPRPAPAPAPPARPAAAPPRAPAPAAHAPRPIMPERGSAPPPHPAAPPREERK